MKLFFSIYCISKIAMIYSFLYVAFNFLYYYLYKKITEKIGNNDDDKEKNKNFYLCLMKSLSNILLIILYFILNKKNEENSNDDEILSKSWSENSNLQIQIFAFKDKKSCNINFIIIFYIFICSLIDFLILFYVKRTITSGFTFFFGFIFFIYIYNHAIYIHHYLGLIIILIIAIMRTIILFFKKEIQNEKEEYIRSLIIYTLLGFQIVIEKYLIEIKFVNKIIILTIEGIFELFFLVVYVFIYYKNHNYKLFSNFYYIYIFILLVDLFVNFSRINSIEYNKNIVFLLFFIFSNYISTHLLKIDDKKIEKKPFYFIILEIINIFGCLIIMELLVLNFCKLNKNIKPQLKKREEFDMQIIN